MLGKFTYFSLGVTAVSALSPTLDFAERPLTESSTATSSSTPTSQQTYDEFYRESDFSANPEVYSDTTELYRIPGWMKKEPYVELLDAKGFQLIPNKVWKTPGSAITLGSGRDTPQSKASQGELADRTDPEPWQLGSDQNDFITAVKKFHLSSNGRAKSSANNGKGQTPHKHPITGSTDPYSHIKNFWLRDGHLFALILDDNANNMIHGGITGEKQADIGISKDGNNQSQRVIPMDHHMEHLRDFCNYMGGDLWAPSSQEEYDDLMERDGGVCDDHVRARENGEPLQTGANSKVEIYLNIHRQGYLRCATEDWEKKDYQDPSNGQALRLECPKVYGEKRRNMDDDGACDDDPDGHCEWQTFETTDPWFAEDINGADAKSSSGGMCSDTSKNVNTYAQWIMTPDRGTCTDALELWDTSFDKPYIPEDCFHDDSEHRFQKFVGSDVHSINDVLSNDNSLRQMQKDCVVATCNNDVGQFTGPVGDRRSKSEWNMDNCNLQRHTGICRIRAFGCNEPTYACKEDYHDFCGSKSVYTKSVTSWANADITLKADGLNAESDITTLTEDEDATEVMFADSVAEQTTLQAWANAEFGDDEVEVLIRDDQTVFGGQEECLCKCTKESCDDNNDWWTNLVAGNINGKTITRDDARGLSYSANNDCRVEVIESWVDQGDSHTWTCKNDLDTCNCYEGDVSSHCKLNDEGTQSTWVMNVAANHDYSGTCANSCCPAYDNGINSLASIVRTDQRLDCFKRGMTYTVKCDGDLHIVGGNDNDTTRKFTIPNSGDCYTPLNCQAKTCGCQEKDNGYCYSKKGKTANFENDDSLICRCNKGYVNVGGVNNLPYDTLTCNSGTFSDRKAMGTCMPVMCANPHELMEGDDVIGKPNGHKSAIDGRITYECAAGYENAQDLAPYSECTDSDPETYPSGQFGCYSAIVGTCKPILGCSPPTADYDNAWGPAIFQTVGDDCHHDDMWLDFDPAFKTRQSSDVFNNGDIAIYECYDDFTAYKEDNFMELTRDISMEVDCADGDKQPDDECRLRETDDLLDEWTSAARVHISTNNDKIVSICENGQWLQPSHACKCQEEIDRLEVEVIRFTYDCSLLSTSPITIRCDDCEVEETETPASAFTNKVVLTTCGLIPAVFYNL